MPELSDSSGCGASVNTSALLARVSSHSERFFVPVNDSALRDDPALPAFYCVHSITGTAGTDFVELARRLDPFIRFYGIQAPPARMKDDGFAGSIESIAEVYTAALLRQQPTGPFLLGGHCAGGIIALEMAQKLRGAGREIALLVVIDAIPENSSAALRRWNPLYFLEMLRNVPGWIEHERRREDWSPRPLPSRTAHNLRLLGRFLVGVRRGKKLDGGNVPEEFMDLSRFPAEQRAFIHRLWGALFTYMPRPYAGKVVVYEAAVKPLLEYPQTRRRWCALVPDVAVVGINGNHNTMLQAPSIGELVSDLKARLAPGAWEPPGSFARQTMGR